MDNFDCKLCFFNDIDPFSTTVTVPEPTIKPKYTFNKQIVINRVIQEIFSILNPPHDLENAVLQLCKFKETQIEYGPFLDFDLNIHEQIEDLDSYLENGNNGIILRTKLSVRVEALIDKIRGANGRELRRVLFSLKQIFQDDKDLVQEFVVRHGLRCLREVGTKTDQNHQNYILRALGQLMLYVDGMNGVLEDPETVEWLYGLLQGKFRLVVKLALKLLVVFIEYAKNAELHATVIVKAINDTHKKFGGKPWSYAMKILSDQESNDSELINYTITFINKVLSSIPDQDTFYDITDCLEEQGMEDITRSVINKKSTTDVDMYKQFNIYETALKLEDGENVSTNQLDDGLRNLPRWKSETNLRKSKRVQEKSPKIVIDDKRKQRHEKHDLKQTNDDDSDIDELSQSQISRKEYRPEIRILPDSAQSSPRRVTSPSAISIGQNGENTASTAMTTATSNPAESSTRSSNHQQDHDNTNYPTNLDSKSSSSSPLVLSVNNFVKDRTNRLTNQVNGESSSGLTGSNVAPTGDRSGIISSAKGSLQSTLDKPPMATKSIETGKSKPAPIIKGMADVLDWEELEQKFAQGHISFPDFDFSELSQSDDESKVDANQISRSSITMTNGVPPPPPPPLGGVSVLPPPPPGVPRAGPPPPPPPPPPPGGGAPPPPKQSPSIINVSCNEPSPPGADITKHKKTMRLHWHQLKPSTVPPTQLSKLADNKTIWNKIKPIKLDGDKFEGLFENKPHDIKKDVKHEVGPKKLEVLDVKRSQLINISMTNLPSIESIKNAIINMHSNVINRDGIEKLLEAMLPTKEEIMSIKQMQKTNPDAQLGSAEKFLLEINDISLLKERLEVWLFYIDFDQVERDILEPLMDLKDGIKEIYKSDTFINILSTLLTLGNFLNGSRANAFSVDYLQKVPEVKDTTHKHTLLYHIVSVVVQEFPNSTDLHSDFSALNRCHRVEWEEVENKLNKTQKDFEKMWLHLKLIIKVTPDEVTRKLKRFFNDASERIMKMVIVYRRVMKRFRQVLLFLGYAPIDTRDMQVKRFCRILADFAIEYRTTREKYFQLLEAKEKKEKRLKTRGSMVYREISSDRINELGASSDTNHKEMVDVIMNTGQNAQYNSLRPRRTSAQPPTDRSGTFPRPSSSHNFRIARNQPSSPASNLTPATSELNLHEHEDSLLDKLAQKATIAEPPKRRTPRRSAGRERKSIFSP